MGNKKNALKVFLPKARKNGDIWRALLRVITEFIPQTNALKRKNTLPRFSVRGIEKKYAPTSMIAKPKIWKVLSFSFNKIKAKIAAKNAWNWKKNPAALAFPSERPTNEKYEPKAARNPNKITHLILLLKRFLKSSFFHKASAVKKKSAVIVTVRATKSGGKTETNFLPKIGMSP